MSNGIYVVITASKAHEVITKMKKVRKGGGGVVNIWSLKENISGKIFVNLNIPALKYGRGIKIDAVNTFAEYTKNIQPRLHYFRMWVGSRQYHVIHWGKPRPVNVMFVLW